MNRRITREQQAGAGMSGMRLDQAAAELFPEFSRARLQAWIRQGWLRLDGRKARPAARLAGGERLSIDAEEETETEVVPQAMDLHILHQDAELLVLDKAAGTVVHPAPGHPDGTLQNALLHYDPGLAAVPRAGIVHRLDKDTSGVMVVARTLQSHAALVRQLQRRSMSRVYHAVVHGAPQSSGTVDAPIGRHPRDRQRMAVVASGKPAVSHYRVLRRFGHFSLLEVSLETGRTHQIRVHMKHIGHPLVGDPVYGARQRQGGAADVAVARDFHRQALHARRLSLRHPATGETAVFEAPLPPDFSDLVVALQAEDPAIRTAR